MRTVQAIILVIFLGAVLIFAIQNTQPVTVWFLKVSVTAPVALLVLTIYVLGMLSGWTVVAILKESIRRVAKQKH